MVPYGLDTYLVSMWRHQCSDYPFKIYWNNVCCSLVGLKALGTCPFTKIYLKTIIKCKGSYREFFDFNLF